MILLEPNKKGEGQGFSSHFFFHSKNNIFSSAKKSREDHQQGQELALLLLFKHHATTHWSMLGFPHDVRDHHAVGFEASLGRVIVIKMRDRLLR